MKTNPWEALKKYFYYLLLCGAVYFGRGLLASKNGSDGFRLSQRNEAAAPQQLLVDYHQASMRVLPNDEQGPIINLAKSLGGLEPTIDRANGCEHLWDMMRISRRLSQRWRHFLNGQALYNMSLCVSDPKESRSWLTLAEYEASWAKQFKTSSPELAQRRNDLYETILRRKHSMEEAPQ